MMKLKDVAGYFNDSRFYDAYSNLHAFKGRIMSFDDATRDALSSERRILSCAPGTSIPARRVVRTGGELYLVGDRATDYHKDGPLRTKFILHQVNELVEMYTFSGAIAGTPAHTLYGTRMWTKALREIDESSGVYDAYTCYFAKGEDINVPGWQGADYFDGREKNVLLKIEGHWHLVRTTYATAGGFLATLCDELTEPVLVDVEYKTRVYNPIPDTYTETITTRKAVMLRWQSNFEYLTRYAEKYEEGDVQLKLRKADGTVKADDLLTIKGRLFRVNAVVDEAPVWSVHLRRE